MWASPHKSLFREREKGSIQVYDDMNMIVITFTFFAIKINNSLKILLKI